MTDQPPSMPLDINRALRLTANDPELLADLGDEFLSQLPERLADLRGALDVRDAERVWHVSHSLKGALASLAAAAAYQRALELEGLGRAGRLDAAGEKLDELERELGRLSDFLAVPRWSQQA